MPIRIIRETERFALPFGDAALFYRRVPRRVRQEIVSRHSKLGQRDDGAIAYELIDYAILGWDGVVDEDGQALPFQKHLIAYLPEEVGTSLIVAINAANPPEDADQKNSRSFSTAGPS